MIENQYHLLLICPFYSELRNTHLPRYYRTWPTTTKFELLIITKSEIKIRNIKYFLYQAIRKRNSQQLIYKLCHHYTIMLIFTILFYAFQIQSLDF